MNTAGHGDGGSSTMENVWQALMSSVWHSLAVPCNPYSYRIPEWNNDQGSSAPECLVEQAVHLGSVKGLVIAEVHSASPTPGCHAFTQPQFCHGWCTEEDTTTFYQIQLVHHRYDRSSSLVPSSRRLLDLENFLDEFRGMLGMLTVKKHVPMLGGGLAVCLHKSTQWRAPSPRAYEWSTREAPRLSLGPLGFIDVSFNIADTVDTPQDPPALHSSEHRSPSWEKEACPRKVLMDGPCNIPSHQKNLQCSNADNHFDLNPNDTFFGDCTKSNTGTSPITLDGSSFPYNSSISAALEGSQLDTGQTDWSHSPFRSSASRPLWSTTEVSSSLLYPAVSSTCGICKPALCGVNNTGSQSAQPGVGQGLGTSPPLHPPGNKCSLVSTEDQIHDLTSSAPAFKLISASFKYASHYRTNRFLQRRGSMEPSFKDKSKTNGPQKYATLSCSSTSSHIVDGKTTPSLVVDVKTTPSPTSPTSLQNQSGVKAVTLCSEPCRPSELTQVDSIPVPLRFQTRLHYFHPQAPDSCSPDRISSKRMPASPISLSNSASAGVLSKIISSSPPRPLPSAALLRFTQRKQSYALAMDDCEEVCTCLSSPRSAITKLNFDQDLVKDASIKTKQMLETSKPGSPSGQPSNVSSHQEQNANGLFPTVKMKRPFAHPLLGTIEDSVLRGCFPVCFTRKDMHCVVSVKGPSFSRPLTSAPVEVDYFQYDEDHGQIPLRARIDISTRGRGQGYRIPPSGVLSLVLSDLGTIPKKCLSVPYDFSDMPPWSETMFRLTCRSRWIYLGVERTSFCDSVQFRVQSSSGTRCVFIIHRILVVYNEMSFVHDNTTVVRHLAGGRHAYFPITPNSTSDIILPSPQSCTIPSTSCHIEIAE